LKRSAAELASDLLSDVDLEFVARSVVPGENVTNSVTRLTKRIRVGKGLRQNGEVVSAVRLGMLRYSPPATYWVESCSMKRYVPNAEDVIVGIVEDRSATQYRVNILGSLPGCLPVLAFQGATKRTKPTLKVGEAVFCRVSSAEKDMDPELSCLSMSSGSRKGWETGEAMFGPLGGGVVVRCTLSQAADLQRRHDHPAFAELARQEIPFEVCIGSNGAVWLKAKTPKLTVCVANVIANSLVLSDSEIGPMVTELLARLGNLNEAEGYT